MKPAFVIIDMQKQFLSETTTCTPGLSSVVPVINYIADQFRTKGAPVIYVLDEEDCGPDHPDFALVESLEIAPSDVRVHKIHGNSFRATKLEAVLKELAIDFILVAGFKAEGCVLSTLKGAEDRDLSYAVLRGGILSTSPNGAAFVEGMSPLMSHHLVSHLLGS